MRFGVFFLSQAPEGLSPRQVLDWELGQIAYAEELGYDSAWLAEHHFTNYCVVNDPLTYAAHVAAQTSRIRIGLAVSVLPLHNPVEVAERCALVDLLSNGRLNVGVGRGYSAGEFARFGVGREERLPRFAEALDIITKLWTEDHVEYEGRFWRVSDTTLYPRPLQLPYPPVYVATSGSLETVAVAAERGFPTIQGGDFITPSTVADLVRTYRERAERSRLPSEAIEQALDRSAVTQKIHVAATREEALAAAEPYVMWRHRKVMSMQTPVRPTAISHVRRRLRPVRRALTGHVSKDFAEHTWEDLQQYDLFGTPDDCIERLQQLVDAGARNVMCWFGYGGMPDEQVRTSMELFAREVMPAFGGTPAGNEPEHEKVAVR